VLKRALLALPLLLACDEARGPILSLRVAGDPAPIGSAGMSAAGGPVMMEGGLPPASGAGGEAVDSGISAGAGGTAGSDAGGMPISCVALPPKPWMAIGYPSSLAGGDTTSQLYNPPTQAVDGDVTERWSTGIDQGGGEWIEIDFGYPVTLTRLELDHKASRSNANANPDFPAQVRVAMSDVSRDFAASTVAEGLGTEDFTMLSFPEPATGRYLFIQQTGAKAGWWSIHELYVFCEILIGQ